MTDKHVVSLELSKQLKEAGWTKETEFWWVEIEKDKWKLVYCNETIYQHQNEWNYTEFNNFISAPLATEILEEFKKPKNITIVLFWDGKNWVCQDIDYTIKIPVFRNSQNPCDVLAKMWIYLKKKNLLAEV